MRTHEQDIESINYYAKQIDYDWMFSEVEYFDGTYDRVHLRPGGFIAGLCIEVNMKRADEKGWTWNKLPQENQASGELHYELTDINQQSLYGKFVVPYGMGFHRGGQMMRAPLPNLNSACPYILELQRGGPDIIVTTFKYQIL